MSPGFGTAELDRHRASAAVNADTQMAAAPDALALPTRDARSCEPRAEWACASTLVATGEPRMHAMSAGAQAVERGGARGGDLREIGAGLQVFAVPAPAANRSSERGYSERRRIPASIV